MHVHALKGSPCTVTALVLLSRGTIDYAAVDTAARAGCGAAWSAARHCRLLAIIEGLYHASIGRGLGQEVVLHCSLVASHEPRLGLAHQVVLSRGTLPLAALRVEEPRARRIRVGREVVSATVARANGSITVELLLATHRAASIREATSRTPLVRLVESVRVAVSRRLAPTRDGCQVAVVVVIVSRLTNGTNVQLRVQRVATVVASDVGGFSHVAHAATLRMETVIVGLVECVVRWAGVLVLGA